VRAVSEPTIFSEILRYILENEERFFLFCLALFALLFVYFIFSVSTRIQKEIIFKQVTSKNDKTTQKLSSYIAILAKEHYGFKGILREVLKSVNRLTNNSLNASLPYTKLSAVYDTTISHLNVTEENLIVFLFDKLTSFVAIVKYCIAIHENIISGEAFNLQIFNKKFERLRGDLFFSCKTNINDTFAEINKDANETIFNEAKSKLLKILTDKKKNDKVQRIMEVAERLLESSLNTSISEYRKHFKKKDIDNQPHISKVNFDLFQHFIVENKLGEAGIELLKSGEETSTVLMILNQIYDYEKKMLRGEEVSKTEWRQFSARLLEIAQKIKEKKPR
jgi:hypothetical protein